MALVFVPETGSGLSTANSLTSVSGADSYYDRVPASWLHAAAWLAEDEQTEKERFLVMATEILRTRFKFRGSPKTTDQRLPFPRVNLYTYDGIYISDSSVPEIVQFATAELAGHLMLSDRTAESKTKGIAELGVDVIKIKFDKRDRAETLPESVISYLLQFGDPISNSNPVKIVSRH